MLATGAELSRRGYDVTFTLGNTGKIDMTPEQQAEWCQQVAIKLVEDAIGGKYEIRGTESVGPKIGAFAMPLRLFVEALAPLSEL